MTIQPASMQAHTQTDAAAPAANGSPDTVSQDQFLQLLVAQIHYQDPTNPTDGTTFVTQLAQFSSLEQLVAIRGDLDGAQAAATGAQNPASTQGGN